MAENPSISLETRAILRLWALSTVQVAAEARASYRRRVSEAYETARSGGEKYAIGITCVETIAENNGNKIFLQALWAARNDFRRKSTPALVP